MSLGLKHVTLPDGSQMAFRVELSFLLYSAPGLSPQTQPEDSSLPQYDLHAETEIKRVMDEVNLLSLGTRAAFGEPIIKNGDDKVHIYLTGEGHGHALAPRRQGQAGVALASQQLSTGKEAR